MSDKSTALTRSSGASMAVSGTFDAEQVELIKTQVMPNASNGELSLFMATCRRLQLDPFAKQIYAIKRRAKDAAGNWVEKWQTQTGIDGFRVVANRSAEYEGQVGPHWCGEDGVWRDVWLQRTPPMAARIGVWRKGFKEPTWGVATYASYCQRAYEKPIGQWANMPDVMLAKCAEALALRKAFPNDLSGIYTREEMQQAENDDAVDVVAEPVVPRAQLAPPVESTYRPEWMEDPALAKVRQAAREVDFPIAADAEPLVSFDAVHEAMNRIPSLFGEAKKRERQVAYYQCFGHVGACGVRWNPGKEFHSLSPADRAKVLERVKDLAERLMDDLPSNLGGTAPPTDPTAGWGKTGEAREPREPGCDDA